MSDMRGVKDQHDDEQAETFPVLTLLKLNYDTSWNVKRDRNIVRNKARSMTYIYIIIIG